MKVQEIDVTSNRPSILLQIIKDEEIKRVNLSIREDQMRHTSAAPPFDVSCKYLLEN